MVGPIITGISKTAEALLKTPAGQRAIKRGTKSVNRFLKKNADDIKPPTPKQQEAGKRLQKSMKKRALNKKVQVGAGSGATGVAVGRKTKSNNRKGRTDFRDMKANALKESRRKREDAFKEGRVRKTRKEAATLLNKGGEVRKRTKENSFVKKLQEDMPLGIGKILTPIESSGIGGAYKKMTKKIVDKVAKKKAGKKTSNMQPLKKPSVKRLKESERAVPRAIGKGIDKVVGKRIPLKDLRKTDAQYRAGLKAGGLVKKKGIDGIAKRGKTRAARSR